MVAENETRGPVLSSPDKSNEGQSYKIIKRIALGLLMSALTILIVYLGPIALILFGLFCQVEAYHEITNIAITKFQMENFRIYSFMVLMVGNYYKFGNLIFYRFHQNLKHVDSMSNVFVNLQKYHHLATYILYIGTLVYFVSTLSRKTLQKSYVLFAITNMTAYILGVFLGSMIENILNGMIWFILPVTLVSINDTTAYMFGMRFGKHSLIKISPKKTWEGYLGAILPTVLCGPLLIYFLASFPYVICPMNYDVVNEEMRYSCEYPEFFMPQEVDILGYFSSQIAPVYFHACFIGLFISTIGPFGGFFSSALKRVFEVKDYSDLIPGHGGIVDRIDCQMFVQLFVNIYSTVFIQKYSQKTPEMIALDDEGRMKTFEEMARRFICQDVNKMELLRILGDIYPNQCVR